MVERESFQFLLVKIKNEVFAKIWEDGMGGV